MISIDLGLVKYFRSRLLVGHVLVGGIIPDHENDIIENYTRIHVHSNTHRKSVPNEFI